MPKTTTMQLLEATRKKPIRDIITDSLESHRGKPFLVARVQFDLGVSDTTVISWCHQLGIKINDYRNGAEA